MPLSGEESKALSELLVNCNDALVSTNQSLRLTQDVVGAQSAAFLQSEKALSEARNASSSIMSNTTLWFVAGMLTAGFTVYLTKP
jgi:hypothetical protein